MKFIQLSSDFRLTHTRMGVLARGGVEGQKWRE